MGFSLGCEPEPRGYDRPPDNVRIDETAIDSNAEHINSANSFSMGECFQVTPNDFCFDEFEFFAPIQIFEESEDGTHHWSIDCRRPTALGNPFPVYKFGNAADMYWYLVNGFQDLSNAQQKVAQKYYAKWSKEELRQEFRSAKELIEAGHDLVCSAKCMKAPDGICHRIYVRELLASDDLIDKLVENVSSEDEKIDSSIDLKDHEVLERLHKAMWHPSKDQMMMRLGRLCSTTEDKKEVERKVEEVVKRCEICKETNVRLGVQPKRLGVVATLPNQWATLDTTIAKFRGKTFACLMMVDMATRWNLCIITEGRGVGAAMALKLIVRWMTYFGSCPTNILVDCGREFIGAPVVDFCSQHGTKTWYSPPYNPQSHGMIERHNAVWKGIFEKLYIEFEGQIKSKVLSANEVAEMTSVAKNSIVRKEGFCSHFLAFGYQPAGIDDTEENLARLYDENNSSMSPQALARLQLRQCALKMSIDDHLRKQLRDTLTTEFFKWWRVG